VKANKFVKENGIEKCKRILDDLTDQGHNGDFYKELKRLVESHDLVESYKGLHCAKNTLGLLQSSMEIGLYHGMDGVDAATEIPRLKQAIADIEACKEVS